mgnify:CR=1 FL=1
MSDIYVIYWSGTGNTEAMANAVAEGMKEVGAEVTVMTPDQVDAGALNYSAIAFGCPAMGSEVLEEVDFQPMFDSCKNRLGGTSVALFGSYGWGDGQWMRDWVERAQGDGAQVLNGEGLICNEAPDDDVQAACRKLGADLAAW